MAIDRNKTDFENALDELDSISSELDEILQDDFIDKMKDVVHEYRDHYKSDIEEMIEQNEAFEEENEELKEKLDESKTADKNYG